MGGSMRVGSSNDAMELAIDGGAPFIRALGGPNRDGSKLLGRPMAEGDDGPGRCDSPPILVDLGGEVGLLMLGAGDVDLATLEAGDTGRARRDDGTIEGLVARGIAPIREAGPGAGEPDLGIADEILDACVDICAVSALSGLLTPGTRRRRSSNWVLSLGDKCPTNVQILSPTRV